MTGGRISLALRYRISSIFHHVFDQNHGLLGQNYWNDLFIIDQGHSEGDVTQFCLYLGYSCACFIKMPTTKTASRPATNNALSADR